MQQMVRYITLQYRDDLLHLRKLELEKSNNPSDRSTTSKRQSGSSARIEWRQAMFSEQQKDQVAMDLLGILQKIPIQVIGTSRRVLVFDFPDKNHM
jgi:hypothetical protein